MGLGSAWGCAGLVAGYAPVALSTVLGPQGSFTVLANYAGQLFQVRDGVESHREKLNPRFDLAPLLPQLQKNLGPVKRLALRDLSRKSFERVGLIAVVRSGGVVELGSSLTSASVIELPEHASARDVALTQIDADSSQLLILSGHAVYAARVEHSDRSRVRVGPVETLARLDEATVGESGGFDYLSAVSPSHYYLASATGFVRDSQGAGVHRLSAWMESFGAFRYGDRVDLIWSNGTTVQRSSSLNGELGAPETLLHSSPGTLIRAVAYAIGAPISFTAEQSEGLLALDTETHVTRLLALGSDGRLLSPWSRSDSASRHWALGWVDSNPQSDARVRITDHPWISLSDRRWAIARVLQSVGFEYTRLAHLRQWSERRHDDYRVSQSPQVAQEVSAWGTPEERSLTLELLTLGSRRQILEGLGERETREKEVSQLLAELDRPVAEARYQRLVEILVNNRGRRLDVCGPDFEQRVPRLAASRMTLRQALLLFLRKWDPLWPGLPTPSAIAP